MEEECRDRRVPNECDGMFVRFLPVRSGYHHRDSACDRGISIIATVTVSVSPASKWIITARIAQKIGPASLCQLLTHVLALSGVAQRHASQLRGCGRGGRRVTVTVDNHAEGHSDAGCSTSTSLLLLS